MSFWKHQHARSQERFVWMKTVKNGQWIIKLVTGRSRIASGIQGYWIITGNLLFTACTHFSVLWRSFTGKILTSLLYEFNQIRNLGSHYYIGNNHQGFGSAGGQGQPMQEEASCCPLPNTATSSHLHNKCTAHQIWRNVMSLGCLCEGI